MLTPGIYKWTSVVNVPVNCVINFDGGVNADAVWIMQIAGNRAINSSAAVLLVNGAKAENIFWAVHTDIAVDTYSHAEGIILTYTMIALQNRSSLNGAAYAQTAVMLDDVTMNRVITGLCAPAKLPSDTPTGSPMVSLSEKSTV